MVGAGIDVFKLTDQIATVVRRRPMHLHRPRAILRGIGPAHLDNYTVTISASGSLPNDPWVRRLEPHVCGRSRYDEVQRERKAAAVEGDVSAVVSRRDGVFIQNRLDPTAQGERDDVIPGLVSKLAVTTR